MAMTCMGTASVAAAAPREGPCEEIIAACRAAGFYFGGAAQGFGLERDCVQPILHGTKPPLTAQPLPKVDPQAVTACAVGRPDAPRATATPQSAPGAPARPPPPGSPSFIFVLTDDLSVNLVQYMPHVLKLQQQGTTFTNYFVTDSLCCPSRSSIFTGRYPHDTGIFRNTGDDGGYLEFLRRGHERETFAVALSAAGYRSAMIGKYLNG
jgi:hypothetical protein